MSDKWRIEVRRVYEVDADDFFTEFDGEWADAQKRGLSRDQFIRETIEIVGEECDLYSDVDSELEFERV